MCQQHGWGSPPQRGSGGGPGTGALLACAALVVLVLVTGAVKHHPLLAQGKKGGASNLAGIFGGGLKLPKIELGLPFSKKHKSGGKGYACPVKGKVRFSDTWGASRSNGLRRHKGVDMFAKAGTKLVAVTNGRVVRAGWNRLGGNGVTIRDKRGTEFYYAHNRRNRVHAGQRVRKGDVVASVGNTGNARHTPSHVHFEVRPHGRPVNPTGYVRAWC